MTNLFSTLQVAEMLSVSPETVRRMIARGDIKSFQTEPSRPHLIPLSEVLRNQKIKPRSVKMTFQEYTEINALNASKIKMLNASLNHFLLMDNSIPKQTPAMNKGLAIHSWVECKLSNVDFDSVVVKQPSVDKRTKAGKEVISQFQSENEGKIILSPEDYQDVVEMGQSILGTPQVWKFINEADVEEVIQWSHEGIRAKARLDYLLKDKPLVVDLKSCQDASPYGFQKAVRRYSYDIQANWYRRAYHAQYGVFPEFWFLAVESKPPYNTGVYRLSGEALSLADAKIHSAIDLFRRYISGEIARQGYAERVVEIG